MGSRTLSAFVRYRDADGRVRSASRGQTVSLPKGEEDRLDGLGRLVPLDGPTSLSDMKVSELRALAQERGIDADGMRKDDLVDALEETGD